MILSPRSFVGIVLMFTIVAAVAIIAQVPAATLTPVVYLLTIVSWASVAVLARAAWIKPRIGALTERAFIAVIIAMLGTVSSLIVWNTDNGRVLFAAEVASLLFRLTILAVLAVPAIWLILWLGGRLGQTE